MVLIKEDHSLLVPNQETNSVGSLNGLTPMQGPVLEDPTEGPVKVSGGLTEGLVED